MAHFEFIMVMLSIIVGLGVAVLLTDIARQIKSRKNCKHYWVQTLWALAILIGLLQQWWESWGLRAVESWTFPMILLMLASPIGLFIIAHLIYPERIDASDIKKYYYETSGIACGIAFLVVIFGTSFRPIAFGSSIIDKSKRVK